MESLSNFYNVFDDLAGRTPDSLLAELIGTLGSAPRPSVIWVSRPVALGGTHTIPRQVTLAFAPGAVITITGRLIVEGDLDAGFEERFSLLGNGVVELLGPLEEIVADWWRPTPWRNPVELALNALWVRYARADRGVLPAPILLDGPYALTRTLRIKPSADVPDPAGRIEVRLRGRWGQPSDPPTFTVGSIPAEEALSAMVSVEEGVVLTMDHVAFDAAPAAVEAVAAACVTLEGTFDGSRIEACAFRYLDAGVRVITRLQHWMATLAGTVNAAETLERRLLDDAIERSTHSANRLGVSRCVFTGVATRSSSLELARGIDVGFGAPTSLAVRDCQFTGSFASGVAILGGEVDVVACQFDNRTTRVSTHDAATATATADILVRRWEGEGFREKFRFVPKGNPVFEPRALTGVDVYRGRALANTHVTVTHCVSTSPRFLVMHQTFPYSDSIQGGAVITNLHHSPSQPGWHSIALGQGMPPRSLTLQGCRLGDSVLLDRDSVSTPSSGRPTTEVVVDLGTVFDSSIGFTLGREFGSVDVITLATTRP